MVKPGYKQTEIGVIPEDWKINFLPSFGDVVSGGTPSTSVSEYWDGDIAWCTPSDITRTKGTTIAKTERYITVKGLANSAAALLPPGCVLLCTRATIGDSKINSVAMATNQGFKNIIPKNCNITFLFYLLQTKKQEMLEKAIGSTFLEISKSALCSIPLQYPPIPEQQRIAEALSDMDELIASLEKLIAKKKAIKQGAMQELLTGKRRLPGFSGEWPSKKLKDCTERIIVGLATSVTQYYREEGIPIFRNLNILPNRLDESDVLYLDPSFAKLYSNKQVKEDDVLTVHTGYVGTSCLVPKNHAGSLTFTTLITTVKKDLLSPQYLAFHLNSDSGAKMIEALQAGGGRNNLNVSDFEQYELTFPQDMDEQVAIANILEDLDKEIGCIEQKHKKSIEIKQGMVQQLLTGKIRLV